MPLYSRTEKRIKRKEREDELGITAVKDALRENGELGDSDEEDEEDLSDESDSDSEDEEGQGSESDLDAGDGDDAESGEEEDGSEREEDESDDEEVDSDEEAEPFPLTIEEVEANPIYPMDDHEGCLLCPGKTLKNDKMKETHLASSSHKRAMKRWKNRLALVDERPLPSDDPRDVMNEILDDLEDRQAGQSASHTDRAAEARGETAGTKRKRKREMTKANKVMRKAEEALKRIENGERAGGDENGDGPSLQGVKGLNRKARRLLAQREREADGTATGRTADSVQEGKQLKATTKAATDGADKKSYKEKKNERKRRAEDKALAAKRSKSKSKAKRQSR